MRGFDAGFLQRWLTIRPLFLSTIRRTWVGSHARDQQAGTVGGTIKIVWRIERQASLSDKEAASYRRSAAA
jgi:hypothetical protein